MVKPIWSANAIAEDSQLIAKAERREHRLTQAPLDICLIVAKSIINPVSEHHTENICCHLDDDCASPVFGLADFILVDRDGRCVESVSNSSDDASD